jgi:hypothetical protein
VIEMPAAQAKESPWAAKFSATMATPMAADQAASAPSAR